MLRGVRRHDPASEARYVSIYQPLTQVFTASRAASHDHFSPSRAEEARAEEGAIELRIILNNLDDID